MLVLAVIVCAYGAVAPPTKATVLGLREVGIGRHSAPALVSMDPVTLELKVGRSACHQCSVKGRMFHQLCAAQQEARGLLGNTDNKKTSIAPSKPNRLLPACISTQVLWVDKNKDFINTATFGAVDNANGVYYTLMQPPGTAGIHLAAISFAAQVHISYMPLPTTICFGAFTTSNTIVGIDENVGGPYFAIIDPATGKATAKTMMNGIAGGECTLHTCTVSLCGTEHETVHAHRSVLARGRWREERGRGSARARRRGRWRGREEEGERETERDREAHREAHVIGMLAVVFTRDSDLRRQLFNGGRGCCDLRRAIQHAVCCNGASTRRQHVQVVWV